MATQHAEDGKCECGGCVSCIFWGGCEENRKYARRLPWGDGLCAYCGEIADVVAAGHNPYGLAWVTVAMQRACENVGKRGQAWSKLQRRVRAREQRERAALAEAEAEVEPPPLHPVVQAHCGRIAELEEQNQQLSAQLDMVRAELAAVRAFVKMPENWRR